MCYNNKYICVLIGLFFFLGSSFIFMLVVIYLGLLFMINMFNVDIFFMYVVIVFVFIGVFYVIFGGLCVVVVLDIYFGILLLIMVIVVVVFVLFVIDFDFLGIFVECFMLIGDNDFFFLWYMLLIGMIFI